MNNMKTNIRNYFLSAVLMMGTAIMLTACAESDSAVWTNPLGDKIYGLWYADYEASGTVGVGNAKYDRVVEAVKFNADGTGTWWKAVFSADQASKPLYLYGGRYPVSGTFDYSTATDGTISAKRRGVTQTDGSPMSLSFHYQDGTITKDGGDGTAQTMKIAPKDFDNVLLALENSMHGAEAENFNINDGNITADNWRQQEAIYIYDGKGMDVQDSKGRTGYSLVNLPWYEGTKLTNLPNDFCKDMTPDNGWEWAANYCGNRSIQNNNFFAVYNKYTGILRFFYYLPEGYDTGNDHVWQVSMSDNLATHTTIPYGVPIDRSLVNKAAINQTGSGTFMNYITPWVDYLSKDGLIVPNAGWWAFDVDLSLIHPETISDQDHIKLQMRSWDTDHSSLFSTMAANIDGTMRGTFEAQTTGSVSMVSTVSGITGMLGKLGGPAGEVVSAYMSGDTKGALTKAVTLASGAYNLSTGKPMNNPGVGGDVNLHTVGEYEGVINMLMNGTINTDGIIEGSRPTVGIASPTLYLKDFDTKNTHLGQGVWNLKKSPVVYTTSFQNIWTMDWYIDNEEKKSVRVNWLLFDPSSIEIELNPNVFPEDDIEWMCVEAFYGSRKSLGWSGTDGYRDAIGLGNFKTPYTIDTPLGRIGVIYIYEYNKPQVTTDQLKFVTSFPGEELDYNDKHYRRFIWGTGDKENTYIICPQVATWFDNMFDDNGPEPFFLPAMEVCVVLTVKLKGNDIPFVFQRLYLPEIKYLDVSNIDDNVKFYEKIKEKSNLSPKTKGHTEFMDYLIDRLNDQFWFLHENSTYGGDTGKGPSDWPYDLILNAPNQ